MVRLRCKDCRFYDPYNQDIHEKLGQCRKNPPVIVFIENDPESYWPEVYEYDWCGRAE